MYALCKVLLVNNICVRNFRRFHLKNSHQWLRWGGEGWEWANYSSVVVAKARDLIKSTFLVVSVFATSYRKAIQPKVGLDRREALEGRLKEYGSTLPQ